MVTSPPRDPAAAARRDPLLGRRIAESACRRSRLWVGGRYVPLDLLLLHHDQRGLNIVPEGDAPLRFTDIAETGVLEALTWSLRRVGGDRRRGSPSVFGGWPAAVRAGSLWPVARTSSWNVGCLDAVCLVPGSCTQRRVQSRTT
jgi:hypothetical protein